MDSRIYTDQQIFDLEMEKIFKNTWVPLCHESELAKPYDFRTITIANEPVIVCRGPDNIVRAFLNVCPHRGMIIERRPSGSFFEGSAVGQSEADDLHVPRLAVRPEGQLRLRQPREGRLPGPPHARRMSGCAGCAAR